jgi:hypothetical protein
MGVGHPGGASLLLGLDRLCEAHHAREKGRARAREGEGCQPATQSCHLSSRARRASVDRARANKQRVRGIVLEGLCGGALACDLRERAQTSRGFTHWGRTGPWTGFGLDQGRRARGQGNRQSAVVRCRSSGLCVVMCLVRAETLLMSAVGFALSVGERGPRKIFTTYLW